MQSLIHFVRRILGIPAITKSLEDLHKKLSEASSLTSPPPPATANALLGNTTEVRQFISEAFLHGDGIEIGAFASPLWVSSQAHVRYVDKYELEQLDASFKIAGLTLADFGTDISTVIRPDIVDDGECLAKVGDLSQDFVIANHVLEHFEDPIKGFKNMLRVLKHGGLLYLSLPEMRHSFDRTRSPTPFDHLLQDYEQGPQGSRKTAYREFATIFAAHGIDKGLFPKRHGADLEKFEIDLATELDQADFSIHFHAWTMDGMLDMFLKTKETCDLSFETRLVVKNHDEVVFIFEKTVPSVFKLRPATQSAANPLEFVRK